MSKRSKSKSKYSKSKRNKTRKIKGRRMHKTMKGGQKHGYRHKQHYKGHKRHHVHSEHMMHGGSNMSSLSPSPFQGQAYNAGHLKPAGNYLPLSPEGVPSGSPIPQQSNPQFGQGGGRLHSFSMRKHQHSKHQHSKHGRGKYGRGKRTNKYRQGGGGLSQFMSAIVPEDILNIGRSIPAAANNFMDKFNGLTPEASSQVYPTQQPLVQQTQQANTSITPPNIPNLLRANVASVMTM
jgi:hypothetical protein